MDFHWPALFNAEADAEGTRDLRLAQNLFHEQLTVSTLERGGVLTPSPLHTSLGANYGYGPKPIISETETLRSETFYFP